MHNTHLLIPCTARKSLIAATPMNLNAQRVDTLDDTLSNWVNAFKSQNDKKSVADLYSGDAFKKLVLLSKEYKLTLHVLSAGFGVVTSDTLLPGYNATFATNINKVPTPHTKWWNEVSSTALPGKSLSNLFTSYHQDRFIINAGNEYLKAIQEDLLSALNQLKEPEKQVVIISSSIPKAFEGYEYLFVKASRKVINHSSANSYGLALTDRNITTIATHLFIEQLGLTNGTFSDIITALNVEFEKLPTPKTPVRTKRDDSYIISYIERELNKQGLSSMAAVFKKYKSEGNACTDTRFRTLFNSIKANKA